MRRLLSDSISINIAAAFGRQKELVAALTDVLADALLAETVVRGCIDEIDARIEHAIEHAAGLFFADLFPFAAQLHGTKSELSHFQSGAPKGFLL